MGDELANYCIRCGAPMPQKREEGWYCPACGASFKLGEPIIVCMKCGTPAKNSDEGETLQ